MPSREPPCGDVAAALVAWQETGDERSLEALVATTCIEVTRVAAVWLRRRGIADRSAIDDTLSLVLDHLRRLHGASPGERAVALFDAAHWRGGRRLDAGNAYLAWLVRGRALDVARRRRRLAQRSHPLSDGLIFASLWTDPDDDAEPAEELHSRFHTAVAQLDPRLRTVVNLLLDGKSQAVIAHALGVCEGTVSRLRTKAIAELKRLLGATQTPPCGGRGEIPAPRARA